MMTDDAHIDSWNEFLMAEWTGISIQTRSVMRDFALEIE
jgi:hypothetical protein